MRAWEEVKKNEKGRQEENQDKGRKGHRKVGPMIGRGTEESRSDEMRRKICTGR